MVDQFLYNFTDRILSKLGSQTLYHFGLAWGVEKELKKLEKTMSTIRNVVLDAEEQQQTNRAVAEWLQRLKEIVLDVDDLVDEFAAEALRRRVETQQARSKLREVYCFFTRSNPFIFRYEVGRKIVDIREKLDDVTADMKPFNFAIKFVKRENGVREREGTYSFVNSSDVIGRESDKEAIQKLLMCTKDDDEKVSIIPIVGMGGLGKTTLAQLVYNDNRVARQFNQRLWVCVSDDFDVKKIIVKLLKAAGDFDCENKEIEQLQRLLREKLGEGNFFIVLDDVWNEDRVEWIKLRDLLMVGAGRSKIVITTRNTTVASIMGTIPSYNLKGLSEGDCLSVLIKWAFKEGDKERHPNLVSIGGEIVKKCGGVPLAARTLGGLLYSKIDEADWLSVRDNDMWTFAQKQNDILPILRLSYDQMQSEVKQCFAYCSLFEKDEDIDKWKLIYLWIAQGFIKPSDPNEELEQTGESYFRELVRRSFLQVEESEYYKMHDLVHDLAQFTAGSECLRIQSGTRSIAGVRHVTFAEPALVFPEALLEVKKLRTILSLNTSDLPIGVSGRVGSSSGLVGTFRYLRVLELSYFLEIHSSIGDLKHLRYLSMVGDCTILPVSLGRLLNLQYLKLHCPHLRELPKTFGNLINLRYLSLSSLKTLTSLPEKEMSLLTSLRVLLIARSSKLTSLSEGIQHLTDLRRLEINECPKLGLLPYGMKHLASLEKLRIESCKVLRFSDDDLQGLRSLKHLTLLNLPRLEYLPKCLEQSAASLTRMDIWYCENLKMLLESLAKFTSLQKLEISSCPSLFSLPEGMQHLTALWCLHIEFCGHLSARCKKGVGEDWAKIALIPELYIDKERM